MGRVHSLKLLAFLSLFIFCSKVSFAKSIASDTRPQNTIYLQGLGGASLLTLVYDRAFLDDNMSFSAGFGYGATSATMKLAFDGPFKYFSFPVKFNYIGLHKNGHGLEVGGGVNLLYATVSMDIDLSAIHAGTQTISEGKFSPYALATIAYRFQSDLINVRLGSNFTFLGSLAVKPFLSFGFSF